jgi:hypothetical protein
LVDEKSREEFLRELERVATMLHKYEKMGVHASVGAYVLRCVVARAKGTLAGGDPIRIARTLEELRSYDDKNSTTDQSPSERELVEKAIQRSIDAQNPTCSTQEGRTLP